MLLALKSDTLPLYTVDEYAETLMAQRISTASGVSQVTIYGPQKYAVRVELNPDSVSKYGLGLEQVRTALASACMEKLWGSSDTASSAASLPAMANPSA